MKKNFIIIIAVVLCLQGISQVVFCPPGAKWNYLFVPSLLAYGTMLNDKLEYTRDTIIGSDTIKILSHDRFFMRNNFRNYGPTLIKQAGDVIFMNNIATNNQWQILYNFAALPGQIWTNTVYCQSFDSPAHYTFTAVSTKTTTISGMPLKQIVVMVNSSIYPGTGMSTITERIGSTGYIFPFDGLCDEDGDETLALLCYQDNSFAATNLYKNYPCDFDNRLGINMHESYGNDFSIYPIPASDLLTVEINSGDDNSYTITDLTGRILKHGDLNSNSAKNELDISAISKGVYVISVFVKDETVVRKKLLIR